MHRKTLPVWMLVLLLGSLLWSAPAAPPATATAIELVSGSKLVFESKRYNTWDIFSANDDGTGELRLTSHNASELYPRANRGYTKIAFASPRDADNYNIFVMNTDGSNLVQLMTTPGEDLYPAWSPDGTKIVFSSNRTDNYEIYTMNADGSGVTQLTNVATSDSKPHWSLDGNSIVFVSQRTGDFGIWKMNTDGSGQVQLSSQPNSQDPAWSPDGTQIAYSADADGDSWHELWAMNADGTNQHLVYDPGTNTEAEARSWSPDGRYIAFSYIHWVYQGDVWVADVQNLQAWDTYNPGTVVPLVTSSGLDHAPDWQTTDILPPTTSVYPLPAEVPAVFTIQWSGYENGPAGFKYYDIQIQDGAGPWQDLLVATTLTSVTYHGTGGHTYSFRSRGHDYAYNVEPWPDQPDAVTTVEPYPPQTSVTPLSWLSTYQFAVSWGGYDPGDSGIVTYDIQYRDNSGPWTDWFVATTQTAATFTGTGGHTYYFRSRAIDNAYNLEDWPADPDGDTHTFVEAWPPQTAVDPLPDHYQGTQIQVTWGGYDPGDSGITLYDVQYKDGTGSWTTWFTQTTTTAATFTGMSGHTYSFRCRATDNAGNVEAWPAGNGDTSVTLYTWMIAGTARDNRETLLADVSADTTPAAFQVLPSGLDGQYASYVTASVSTYEVDWAKTGYTALPDTTFGGQSASYDVIVPPGDNVVQSWGFETTTLAPDWLAGGATLPSITDTLWTTGDSAALLGCQLGDFAAPWNVSNLNGTSYTPMLTEDSAGNLYATWYQNGGGNPGEIFYAYRPAGGIWQPAENVSNSPALAEAPKIAVSGSGVVHIAWTEDPGGTPEIYYARRQGGSWSTPVDVSLNAGISRDPQLAVQSDGTVHLLWRDATATPGVLNVYYAQRTTSWSAPVQVSANTSSVDIPRLAVESGGIVHAVWSAGEVYYARRDGSWSAPVAISTSSNTATAARLALSGTELHALWIEAHAGGSGVYYARNAGSWSAPANVYSTTTTLAEPQVALDGAGALHAVWTAGTGNDSEIFYALRSGGTWSAAENLSNNAGESGAPQLAIDGTNAAQVVWVDKSTGNYEILYRDRNGGVWSPLKNASRNSGRSDQPRILVEGSKTVHLVWADATVGTAAIWHAQAATNVPAGDSSISQRVAIPSGMTAPTLSFFYLLDGASSPMGSSLSVLVTTSGGTTTLMSTNASVNEWTHRWFDLSAWAGQTITLTARVTQAANRLCTWGYLDEVTLGGSYPDLWIAKYGGTAGLPGSNVIYHLSYGNRGGVMAAGVQVIDTLPPELTYLAADPPPDSTSPLTWNLGSVLALGGPYEIVLTATVQPGATLWSTCTNTVSIATTTPELETSNNAASAATLIAARIYLPVVFKSW